jgi:UPF0755 protein
VRRFTFAPLALIGLAFAVAVAGYLYITGQYAGPGPLTTERTVVFEHGSGARTIATRLEENRVIEDARMFLLGLWLAGDQGSLKAGEYAFAVGISAEGVAAKLSKGDTVVRRMTFAEGMTSAEIIASSKPRPASRATSPDAPDGTLLPETYHYGYGDPRDSIRSACARA